MSFYSEFASVYERVFPLRPPVLAGVLQVLGDQPRRVLDIGCGPAHLITALRSHGHECTGIDLDDAMIAHALRSDPALDLHVLDMRRLSALTGTFSAALCLGNVLPHLENADLESFLGRLHGLLAPGSPWLVQTVNFDALSGHDAWKFPDLDVGDGLVFKRSYHGLTGMRFRFRTRLQRDGEALFEGDVGMTPFLSEHLAAAHAEAGFTLKSIHADFAGTPYEPASSAGRLFTFQRDET